MLNDSEVDVLIAKYKPNFIRSSPTHRRKSIIAPVISALRKVFSVDHSDLDEADVTRESIHERFRDKITYQLCDKFYEKKSVVVYSSPAKICLISESLSPTPEDLNILADEGIEYADIKWSVDRLEFGSWIGAARSYNVTFSGFTKTMSIISEDVHETLEKAKIRALHEKNPALWVAKLSLLTC